MLTITGLPGNYSPGQEAAVTVTLRQSSRARYGFQVTAIDDQGRAAGDLVVTDANRTQRITGNVGGNQRQYIEHTSAGVTPNGTDQNSWTFTWRAPAQSVGRVTFYVAGNAANGNNANSGDFIYTINQSVQPVTTTQIVTVVNAASFDQGRVLTPDAIAAAFGSFVTQDNQAYSATSIPLPTTLGGVRVRVGNADAGLFFVAPSQINFRVPSGLADNPNITVTVTNSDNSTRTGAFAIVRGAPGVFTAKATGTGVAAAQTTFDGAVYQNIYNANGDEVDVDAGSRQRPNVLILYTTGVRNTPAANPGDGNGVAEAVTVRFQGVPGQVLFAGPAPGFEGLDQINVIIPPELAGLGSIRLVVRTNNRDANAVTMKLGGVQPAVRVNPISFGQTVNGELTFDDQVQKDNATGNTFFFDAYRFTTTAANTTIAADLRSTQFDAAALLYRIDNNTLTFLAVDDETGTYANGRREGHNAMLLTVLQNPGDYVIFASTANEEPNGVGQYTLTLRNNVATQLSYGQSASNPAITNTDLQTAPGDYLDVYWFNGASGDNVRINMASTAFDSLLILQYHEGDPPLTFDDNSGGGPQGRDAQITFRLTSSGIHIIIATPFEPNRTGAYTLSLNRLTSFGPEGEDEFNYKAPGREVRDERGPAPGFGETSFERFGRRRIVEQ
jgi:uncharacterized protein (TIGR03437 family)